jgi:manganese transport protein
LLKRLRSLGPGLIVMAAFMGPASVTVASVSGANFGFVVAWSVVFATVATIILQETSARLGLVSREGLGEALRTLTENGIEVGGLVVNRVLPNVAEGTFMRARLEQQSEYLNEISASFHGRDWAENKEKKREASGNTH